MAALVPILRTLTRRTPMKAFLLALLRSFATLTV
jgi:hypothetical protein